jgi:hypothetical protein
MPRNICYLSVTKTFSCWNSKDVLRTNIRTLYPHVCQLYILRTTARFIILPQLGRQVIDLRGVNAVSVLAVSRQCVPVSVTTLPWVRCRPPLWASRCGPAELRPTGSVATVRFSYILLPTP